MKNKKGFTLVEVLAILAVLGVMVMLIFPNIGGTMSSKKEKELEKLIGIAESAGKAYFSFNDDVYKVNLDTLKNDKYITAEMTDPNTGELLDGCVRKILNNEDVFEYHYGDCKTIEVPLVVELNGGTPNQTFNEKYEEGTKIELINSIKENAEFEGWKIVRGNSELKGNTLRIGTTETEIWALWESYASLEVDLDGGTDNIDYVESYKMSAVIELEVPTKENYKFTGWTVTSGNGVISGNTLTMGSENTIIKATWELNAFKLDVELNGGSTMQIFETEYAVGSEITLETPTKTGYTFESWSVSGSGTSIVNNVLTMGTEETTITANYRINKVYVKFHVNGGTITSSTTSDSGIVYNWTTSSSIIYLNGGEHKQKINYGATDDLANYNNSKYMNITKTGYVASDGAEWICSSGCTTANKTFDHSVQYNASDFCDASNGDCTVTVKVNWEPKTIKVTFNKNDGSGSAVNQTFTYGVSGNKFGYDTDGTAKWGTSGDFGSWTRSGYDLLGWATSSSATSKNYSIYSSVTDNWIDTNYPSINLYAVWKKEPLYIYKSGDLCTTVSGGWSYSGYRYDDNSPAKGSSTGSTYIQAKYGDPDDDVTPSWEGCNGTQKTVNFAGAKKLYIDGYTTAAASTSKVYVTTKKNYLLDGVVAQKYLPTSRSTISIDVSSLSGKYYVVFGASYSKQATSKVYNMWLEY